MNSTLPLGAVVRIPRDGLGRFRTHLLFDLAVSYDVTSPMLAIHGVPWITNTETLDFQIQTEPGSNLVVEGILGRD